MENNSLEESRQCRSEYNQLKESSVLLRQAIDSRLEAKRNELSRLEKQLHKEHQLHANQQRQLKTKQDQLNEEKQAILEHANLVLLAHKRQVKKRAMQAARLAKTEKEESMIMEMGEKILPLVKVGIPI